MKDPETAWDDFFAANKPPAAVVAVQMFKLLEEQRHEQLIAALRAALINGQAQPWMYTALAGSMEIKKFPKDEVDRVVLSMTDFGQADFSSMMYSGAFLVRFGRTETGVEMYRQASRLAPERSEPYLLVLEHEKQLSAGDVLWAACGVLQHDWSQERAAHLKTALDALAGIERTLTQKNDSVELEAIRKAVSEARAIDVKIELTWNGAGDLDLEVEEPGGSICAIGQPQTAGGGYLLGDGYGPRPEDCKETYVCPSGMAGEYRVRVKQSFEGIVGNRATIILTTHVGTPNERREQKTLIIQDGVATASMSLDVGRRTQPRMVQIVSPPPRVVTSRPAALDRRRDPGVVPAGGEQAGKVGAGIGVVGYQPIIRFINEGATLGAHAVISPDRRYVRLGISPMLSNITDVFTFSVFGGGGNQPNR